MKSRRLYLSNQPCLNVSELYRHGVLESGYAGCSSSTRREKTLWSFDWAITSDLISVTYNLHEVHRQHRIKLFHQPVHFGGTRTYLICPYCGMNRKQIYFISGHAACRCCHGLDYRCQSESPLDRSIRASNRLYKRFDKLRSPKYSIGIAKRKALIACLNDIKSMDRQFKELARSRFNIR